MLRKRLRKIASCSSVLAMAAAWSGTAQAQCVPSPSQAGQPVTCTGSVTGGYTLSSDQSPLTVAVGATVQNSGDALTVAIPATSFYDPRTANITVAGSVISTGGTGINFTAGPSDGVHYDFAGTTGMLTVAAGGSVAGVTGIRTSRTRDYLSTYAPAYLGIDNFGTITGTGGLALATGFTGITNEASGTIGAIAATFNSLDNFGLIDGGSLSAVATAGSLVALTNSGTIQAEGPATTILASNAYAYGSITNSGTISNTGAGAAIDASVGVTNLAGGTITAAGSDVVTGSLVGLVNSGTIANLGAGEALSGTTINVTNNTGGVISAGSGGTAINASGSLALVNMGTINGNVLAGSAASQGLASSVDSTQGTINGNLAFGDGNNTLAALMNDGELQTGVTGTITAGSGVNTVSVAPAASVTLSAPLSLPNGFTQIDFNTLSPVTVTLASGFGASGTVLMDGAVSLINAADLSGTGRIIGQSNSYGSTGSFTNSGTITSANTAGPAAIALTGSGAIANSGSISASGSAISFSGGGFSNSGTITAGATAVDAFVYNYTLGFTNSGTITSTGGTAVSLYANYASQATSNSGTISGQQVGLNLVGGTFVNAGTITSPGYGVVLGQYGSAIENLAGGVITGGTVAIGNPDYAPVGASVSNAGTINGDVNLAGAGGFFTNTYYAVTGGILNGNLALGRGDTLVTDLANPGSGAFAGINGTVTASGSKLVYNVTQDASTPATSSAGFASVGYQLVNDPTLTVATGTLTTPLTLAGTGNVVVNGSIATTDAAALQSTAFLSVNVSSRAATALTITNNGDIAATRTNIAISIPATALLGTNDTLTNNGTIALTDTTGNPQIGYNFAEAAISGGQSIVNTGTITGTGADGIALGAGYSSGPSLTLTNSGTISSDLVAVTAPAYAPSAATISNSGTISSTGSAAISGTLFVDNLAGGNITGTTDAVDLTGGTLANAGTITGNVNLGSAGLPSYYGFVTGPVYISQGGTIAGNLTLNPGSAVLVDIASVGSNPFGSISGTVTATDAALVYTVEANTTAQIPALPAGFDVLQYQLGNNPALTLTPGGGALGVTLALAGTGTVTIDAPIRTTDQFAVSSQPAVTNNGIASTANALTIVNNAAISAQRVNAGAFADYYSTVSAVKLGAGDTLTNSGSIAFSDVSGQLTSREAAVTGGSAITNTGTIAGQGVSAIGLGTNYGASPTLTNSGTISSDQTAIVLNSSATITNSGTITSSASTAIAASPSNYFSATAAIVNLAGGTITGAGDAIDLLGGTVSNAGTIDGNVNLAYLPYGGTVGYAIYGGYFDNGGTLNGDLTLTTGEGLVVPLGSANDALGGVAGTITANGAALVYNVTADATVTPALSGGFGAVGYQLSNNSALTIAGGSNLATTLGLAGTGTVTLDGAIATIDQPALFSQPAITASGLSSSPNTLSIINNGTISLTTVNGYASAIQLGSDDTLVNNGTISVQSADAGAKALAAVYGGQSITNHGTITGNATFGILAGSTFTSSPLTVTNTGTIATGNLAVDAFTTQGDITITNSGTIIGAVSASYGDVASASPPVINIDNSGTITAQPNIDQSSGGQQPVAIYVTQTSRFFPPDAGGPYASAKLINSGAITGDIALYNVDYSLVDTATGTITGNIAAVSSPGATSGSITLAGGFAGDIDGGGGLASLAISGGSPALPVAFGNLANISTYTQTGGYATLGGVADLGGAAINGGSLVGLVGSTINTPLLTIGAGGTFASGGTVNGNLSNGGHLQVGASPDTLTVNGNVTLAPGSTSTFEVSPSAASKLAVSGTVTIAANTTLQIVQLQPIMPGTTLDLIDAAGGISGSFSALSGISGKLEEKGGNLSLLALFDTSRLPNSQLVRGVGYVNALIESGKAPAALLAAIPGLSGTSFAPSTAAFARLTAEPYASATQIGAENALTLSRAAREIDWGSGWHSGDIFTFGQALGGRRGLDGDAARGISTADISGYGFLGGLGLSHGALSVAAFGGYLDETQTTAALGASTEARGFVGGVTGRLDSGPARLAVSVLHDDSHAHTRRQLLDGSQLSAGFDLHSWSFDGEASTRLALGADWVARPHIGSTWVWTRRGAAGETNSSIFALTVAADHHTAGYVDGGIRFESPDGATTRFTRYLDLGIRYQLQGRGTQALAGFAGGPITLLSDGARRSAASALVSAGGNYRITRAVGLFLSGSGEMTRTGNSFDAAGGVRISF